jgi:hypothetical protein
MPTPYPTTPTTSTHIAIEDRLLRAAISAWLETHPAPETYSTSTNTWLHHAEHVFREMAGTPLRAGEL